MLNANELFRRPISVLEADSQFSSPCTAASASTSSDLAEACCSDNEEALICTMRFWSTVKVLAKCQLKYYKVSG